MLTDGDIREWERDMRRLFGAALALAGDPEITRSIAKTYRALVDALIAEGFSTSDAVTLVASNHVAEVKR